MCIRDRFKCISKSNLEFFYINDIDLLDNLTNIATKKNNNIKEILIYKDIIFNNENGYLLERLTSKNCKVQKIDFLVEQTNMKIICLVLSKTKIKEITIYLKTITLVSVKSFMLFFKLNLSKIILDDSKYYEYPKRRKNIENLLDFKYYTANQLLAYLNKK